MTADKKVEQAAPRRVNPYDHMLVENRMNPTGYTARQWDASIPVGIPFEKVCEASYWKQCASRLGPLDLITVYADDGSYWAQLLVTQSQPTVGAAVRIVQHIDLAGKAKDDQKAVPSKEDEYEIAWRGFLKHCVIRKSDGTMISKGNESKADAQMALNNHLKSLLA